MTVSSETHAELVTALLHRLIASYVDAPRAIELDYRCMEGRTDWQLYVDLNDQRIMVGREAQHLTSHGTETRLKAPHIKSLKFILAEIGDKVGLIYKIKLEEPRPGGVRIDGLPRRPIPICYDHKPAKSLLESLLTEILAVPASVVVVTDAPLSLRFLICCHSVQDHEKMTSPVEGEADDLTLLVALNHLFRTAGHRDGVRFNLEMAT